MKLPQIKENDKQVIVDAINAWGKDAQVDMLIEECAELIVALEKTRRKLRKQPDDVLIFNVQDELADVFCMVNQGAYIFGVDGVQEQIDFKLNRAKKRIEEGVSN